VNTIRQQQNDEPARERRSPGAEAPILTEELRGFGQEAVGVVGGSMSGKGSGVNTGDLGGQEAGGHPPEVRAATVAEKSGNADGAKGGREVEASSERQREANSPGVPGTDKQGEEDLWQRCKAERGVWSEKMLMALEGGVKGNVWFSLIDKVGGDRTLELAWEKVRSNAGACGVDGMTVGHFAKDSAKRLLAVKEYLKAGTYQPKPVKRVMIPKLGSREKRPLGIPTVRDRIVQTATRMVIEPIFEREFSEHSYGFRPGRGCKDALRRVDELLENGLVHVVDVDIKGYFDSIPHQRLMELVGERIADGRVLGLIESFLKAKVMEPLGWREAEEQEEGTPQGGVISPLLANIYLNPLDHQMSRAGHEMVRYADDMVILCPSAEAAEEVLQSLREWCAQAGLELHAEKTKIVDMGQPKGHFEFLGYRFWRGKSSGRISRHIRPKSEKKLRENLRPLLKRCNANSLSAIALKLNPKLKGFYGYFKHASRMSLEEVDGWVRGRLRSILRKRAGRKGISREGDHPLWPNHYFTRHGLFSLKEARSLEIISLRKAVTN
jgi:RNA-directed DNA polymerase